MAESKVEKFRVPLEMQAEIDAIHTELGKGDRSDTMRLLVRLGIVVFRERQAWAEKTREEGKRRGLSVQVT
jgi:hypothetical protein